LEKVIRGNAILKNAKVYQTQEFGMLGKRQGRRTTPGGPRGGEPRRVGAAGAGGAFSCMCTGKRVMGAGLQTGGVRWKRGKEAGLTGWKLEEVERKKLGVTF